MAQYLLKKTPDMLTKYELLWIHVRPLLWSVKYDRMQRSQINVIINASTDSLSGWKIAK